VDRAVSNIAFTRHCTGTSGSSFKALPRLGRCVSYKEHDEVAPRSARSPVLLANAASVSASDSLVNLASDPRPHGSRRGHKETHTVTDGLGAIKAFDYMSGTTAAFKDRCGHHARWGVHVRAPGKYGTDVS
jgi:hypothetical protein